MSRSQIALRHVAGNVVLVVVGSCASAGNGSDDPVRVDAAIVRDAPAPGDAAPPIDALAVTDAPPALLDAPPGSLICTTNSQCTVAGQCCLTLGGAQGFCTPGTIFLGECTPF